MNRRWFDEGLINELIFYLFLAFIILLNFDGLVSDLRVKVVQIADCVSQMNIVHMLCIRSNFIDIQPDIIF